jgi:hypothetical protein
MSQVKEFHLLHGIVLTKVLRNEQPTLRLVETDTANNAWAAYILNDAVIIYVKYSLVGMKRQRAEKISWKFNFQPSELEKIQEMQGKLSAPVHFTLVGGFPSIDDAKQMQVCLLEPSEIDQCIDIASKKTQTITVEVRPRESLRVYGPKNSDKRDKLVISRNRLDEWKIPGS